MESSPPALGKDPIVSKSEALMAVSVGVGSRDPCCPSPLASLVGATRAARAARAFVRARLIRRRTRSPAGDDVKQAATGI